MRISGWGSDVCSSDLAARMGELAEYPFVPGIDGYPQIIAVTKLPHETVNFGRIWHSDTAYPHAPPMATMLLAREVPPAGGEPLLADMYAASDSPPPPLPLMPQPLCDSNRPALARVTKPRPGRPREAGGPA